MLPTKENPQETNIGCFVVEVVEENNPGNSYHILVVGVTEEMAGKVGETAAGDFCDSGEMVAIKVSPAKFDGVALTSEAQRKKIPHLIEI